MFLETGSPETLSMHKSLRSLEHCINLLSNQSQKDLTIPYRSSKLTRVLKDSLGK